MPVFLSYFDPDINRNLRRTDDPYRLLEPRAVRESASAARSFLLQHLAI